jgi:hypothetical protein
MRQAFACLLLVLATILLADPALACSCARNPTAEKILEGATAVFTGTVRQSVPATPGHSMTTFTVTESFKGVRAGSTVRVVHRSGSSASCGVKFAPGETRTLAAHGSESERELATTLCSTWMFLPHVPISAGLIQQMRALTGKQ